MPFRKSPIILFIMIAEFPEIHFFLGNKQLLQADLACIPCQYLSVVSHNTARWQHAFSQITSSAILPSMHSCWAIPEKTSYDKCMSINTSHPRRRGFGNNFGDGDTVTKPYRLSLLLSTCSPRLLRIEGEKAGASLKLQPGRFSVVACFTGGCRGNKHPTPALHKKPLPSSGKPRYWTSTYPPQTHGYRSCHQNQMQLWVAGGGNQLNKALAWLPASFSTR